MNLAENETTEFKKTTGELKQGIISMCAILNKHRQGTLYFGIKNDGTISGQDVSEKSIRDISQSIANHLDPKIYPKITRETFNNINFIKVSFNGNDNPYFAYGRSYIRVGDEDKLLSPAELEKMILHKNIYQSKWDSTYTEFKVNELNEDTLRDFISQTELAGKRPVGFGTVNMLLSKLKLVQGDTLSFAAWHLFTDNQPVELQAAVFRGTNKTSFSDIKNFRGNIFTLFKTAVAYLNEKINWRVEFGNDMKRHEIPEVPIIALREALVNSFVHRDYNDPKSNEIAIFDDRIEIYNPGSFPAGLKPADFFKGEERSYLRNPKIAEIFYYTKDIDRWGSGFQRIEKECKKWGVQFRIKLMQHGLLVIFYRTKTEDTTQKSSQKSSQKIIKFIQDKPEITIIELAEILGVTSRAVAKQIAKLKEAGILKRIGPDKGGYWEVVEHKK